MTEPNTLAGVSAVLTTARLDLRPIRPHDAPALHGHWTHPNVRRYLWDDEVISREQVEEIVARSEQVFTEHGYGLWALRRRGQRDSIGCGGYWPFHDPPQIELVLSLSPPWWGRGLASEAGAALLSFGFEQLGMETVRTSTDAPNTASQRLIDRLGFAFSHRTESEGLDTLFYVRRRSTGEPTSLS